MNWHQLPVWRVLLSSIVICSVVLATPRFQYRTARIDKSQFYRAPSIGVIHSNSLHSSSPSSTSSTSSKSPQASSLESFSSSPTPAVVIRHPSTCTYDRSQAACTFQLLCYLANGTPVEGCNDSSSATCCYLKTATVNSGAVQSASMSNSHANNENHVFTNQPGSESAQLQPQHTFAIRHDTTASLSPPSQLHPLQMYRQTHSSGHSSSLSAPSSSHSSSRYVSRIPAHYLSPVTSKFRTVSYALSPSTDSIADKSTRFTEESDQSIGSGGEQTVSLAPQTSSLVQQRFPSVYHPSQSASLQHLPQQPQQQTHHLMSADVLNTIRRSRTDPPPPPPPPPPSSSSSFSSGITSKVHFPSGHSHKKLWSKDYDIADICGRPMAKPRARIIGGQDAYFGEFPWQVHIKITKHQCGGALLNNRYIVTAAHCIYQAPMRQLNVIIGAHDIEDARFQDVPPQYFGVEKVILHPDFKFSASHPDRFDLALVRLDRQVRFSDSVLPVCLPEAGTKFEGWKGIVTGWGKTDPALSNRYGTRLLQKVEVPIIDNEQCETWHRTRGIDLTIFDEMMCAGYEEGERDACVGDSGGPLVTPVHGRWTLAGITSAGFGCAQTRQPGIYHRVSNSVNWIKKTLKHEMASLESSLRFRH